MVTTLAEHIRDSGVDLVVMTTHGRGGMQRARLGSITDQLIRTVDVPVMVLRALKGAPPDSSLPNILVPLDGSVQGEAALEPAQPSPKTRTKGVEVSVNASGKPAQQRRQIPVAP